VRLLGYTARYVDHQQLGLTLFWQKIPLPVVPDFKVFVHVRSPDGRTVLQADHRLLEGFPYEVQAAAWKNSPEIRDQVVVNLPPTVDLKQDRFMVGIYQTESGQRWPLLDDQSGENGIWLEEIP
jgi:hypothetical protein